MQAPPVINFKPAVKQWQAYEALQDHKISYVGYGGSAFSGKSYLMCYWLTIMSLGYPGTAWGLCRKELVTLKKTTLITLFKVFKECDIRPKVHYNYNKQLNVITFWNESQIFLIDTAFKPTDPEYQRFGGYELTGAGIDESAEGHYKAVEILSTRIGRRRNDEYSIPATILETFNPDKGHVYRRYYKPWKDSVTPREDGRPIPPMPEGYIFIKALPSDNPSPEVAPYVKRILSTGDKITIERLIHGNFEYDDDPLKLYNYDKILELFTNSFILPTAQRYITADLAYEGADIFVIGVWYGLVLEETIDIDKISEVLVAKRIHEARMKYNIPMSNVLYDADGVKRFVRQAGQKGGLLDGAKEFHNGASPIEVEGEKENFFNLKAQCAWKLVYYLDNNLMFLKAVTSDQRERIIEEFESIKKLQRMDDKEPLRLEKKEDLRLSLGRSPDYWDMIMMRMFFELKPARKNNSWASRMG